MEFLLDVRQLAARLRDFAEERDWGQFHTPKNLAMALAGEAGEVLAELQWLTDAEIRAAFASDSDTRRSFGDELADVMIYLTRLADVSGIDLNEAVASKLATNAQRFPPNADNVGPAT